MMKKNELKRLLERYESGEATEQEKQHLYQHYNSFLSNNTLEGFNEKIAESTLHKHEDKKSRTIRRFVSPQFLLKIAATLFIISSISLLYIKFSKLNPIDAYQQKSIAGPIAMAIAVLPSGDTLLLNSNTADNTAKLQHVVANGINQRIVVKTPRGTKIQFSLPDGSHVWLNSDSKLTYSSSFSKQNREVSIEGEAYFEIAKMINNGKREPFIVKSNRQEIEVLGTKFNVNNYDNEINSVTTLLEGSVSIRAISQNHPTILIPGQQFVTNGKNSAVSHVDERNVISWKDGYLLLIDQNFSSLARTIERNYNVKFSNLSIAQDEKLSGELQTNVELDELLSVLELNLGVKFKRNNDIITLFKD